MTERYILTGRAVDKIRKAVRQTERPPLIIPQKRTTREFVPPTDIRVFKVISNATGDGVYNCYEQQIIDGEWTDTDGTDRFQNKDTTPVLVEVLNLNEADVEPDYARAMVAGDLMAAFESTDSAGNTRWLGIFINELGVGVMRQADIQSVGAASFVCKLWNWTSGGGWALASSTITVSITFMLGSNDADGNVWPKFAAGDTINCYKELDGSWWWPGTMDDTEVCS